jgi:cytosine deaminase
LFGTAGAKVFAVWVVVVGRTVADYWLNWPMYFPEILRAPSSGGDYMSHEHYMRRALQLAKDSYDAGGCPIGAVLVAHDNGAVLGEGHNNLVQEQNPIVHGEMAALRDARRTRKRGAATMYTTLQPCFMCAGAIIQFGIPRVVIGDAANASSDETIRIMREHGVEVIVLDSSSSDAARECIELAKRFKGERPDLWAEDWGQIPQTV